MIYRLIAKTDESNFMADFDNKQDALDKKKQFELWDSLKPKDSPHTVTIYEIPEQLYSVIHDNELEWIALENSEKIKDYVI